MTTLQPFGRDDVRAQLQGLHTATKRLADGKVAIYAYITRGGPLLARGMGRDLVAAKADLEAKLGHKSILTRLAEIDREKPRQSTAHVFGLVTGFLASPEFAALAASTQTAYRYYLERFRADFGDWRVSHFERADAVGDLADWRDEMAETPRAADYAIASVGRLFKWARSRGMTKAEPTKDLTRLHKSNRSDVIWTEADLEAFYKHASLEMQWVIRLAIFTGLRQGDLLALPWSAVFPDRIALATSKRNALAVIPLLEQARALLESIPRHGPVVLTSSLERPWTPDGFRSSFRRTCLEAGVDKHFHDLRGTAVTRLQMADTHPTRIAAIMGWSMARVERLLSLYGSANVIALDTVARMDQKRASTNQSQTGSNKSTCETVSD